MEYCALGTLRDALPELSQEQVSKIETELNEGMKHFHLKSIAHRDIKADNILVARDGAPKYADFGSAKTLKTITKKNDINSLKTVLCEVKQHLYSQVVNPFIVTDINKFIEPKIQNDLISVSEVNSGQFKNDNNIYDPQNIFFYDQQNNFF